MPQLTPSQLNGLVFTSADVLEGTATANGTGYTFNTGYRVGRFGSSANFTISNPNDANNTFTITLSGTGTFYDGTAVTATLLGNDASDFLVSGSLPPGGFGNALIANTAFNDTTGATGTTYTVAPLAATNTYTPPATACFATGTRILTPTGEVAVETLYEGDQVITQAGEIAEIVWVGARQLRRLRSHGRPDSVLPIRIRAGAIEDGMPSRDLILSPDHALFLEGCLVPAKALLNGISVLQMDRDEVIYHHVELARHDVLIADGTPCESYLDTGNRSSFHSAGSLVALHPDLAGRPRGDRGCAPLVETGPTVERIRTAILARCDIAVTEDAEIALAFDADGALIVSRSQVAGHLTADPSDRRILGIKLAALSVDGRELPLDHTLLNDGWHDIEPDGRWTDGHARIPAALLQGSTDVTFTLAATGRYLKAA